MVAFGLEGFDLVLQIKENLFGDRVVQEKQVFIEREHFRNRAVRLDMAFVPNREMPAANQR
jgi:hypothetical protein